MNIKRNWKNLKNRNIKEKENIELKVLSNNDLVKEINKKLKIDYIKNNNILLNPKDNEIGILNLRENKEFNINYNNLNIENKSKNNNEKIYNKSVYTLLINEETMANDLKDNYDNLNLFKELLCIIDKNDNKNKKFWFYIKLKASHGDFPIPKYKKFIYEDSKISNNSIKNSIIKKGDILKHKIY